MRRQSDSPLGDLWERTDKAMDSVLDTATFAQLVRDWTENTQPFCTELGRSDVF